MRKLVFFLLAALLLLSACTPKKYDESNIHELYDANWLIGKTAEQIQDKYGKFDRTYTDPPRCVYFVNEELYDSWLDPNNISDSYFIEFDENGVAVKAYFAETSQGG